jgi:hypothetical protein
LIVTLVKAHRDEIMNKYINHKTALILTTFVAGLASHAWASPVGMVAKMEGAPTVRSDGKVRPLRKLERLEPEDVVSCKAGDAAVVVLFRSGERFQVGGGQNGTVQASTVRGARSLGKLGGPSANVARELGNSRAGAVMGRNVGRHQRLNPTTRGWMTAGDRHFAWQEITGSTAYTFSLFDRAGNILWSTRTVGTTADYPAELPALDLNKPYLWRLSGFKPSGKPLVESRWGVMTWLSREDRAALEAAAADLETQANATPASATPLLQQLAILYSDYGVFNGTLDILGKMDENGEPGAKEAYNEACKQISDYASFLAGIPVSGATESHG